jgi:hypothetical protein
MSSISGWRRFLACATIDILLLVAAGSAMAAPATRAPAATAPVMPALLVLGVGLCGLPLQWRTGD